VPGRESSGRASDDFIHLDDGKIPPKVIPLANDPIARPCADSTRGVHPRDCGPHLDHRDSRGRQRLRMVDGSLHLGSTLLLDEELYERTRIEI